MNFVADVSVDRQIVERLCHAAKQRESIAGADEPSMLTTLRRYHGRTAAQLGIMSMK